eukprot:8763572-Pyramimonas_sp.AAC.1
MRRLYRDAGALQGQVRREAPYLGGRLHFLGSAKPEIGYRMKRAKQAVAALGSFWTEVTNERWRAVIFKSMVEGA